MISWHILSLQIFFVEYVVLPSLFGREFSSEKFSAEIFWQIFLTFFLEISFGIFVGTAQKHLVWNWFWSKLGIQMLQILNPSRKNLNSYFSGWDFCFDMKWFRIWNLNSDFSAWTFLSHKIFRISNIQIFQLGFAFSKFTVQKMYQKDISTKKTPTEISTKKSPQRNPQKKHHQINLEKICPKNLWRESIYPKIYEKKSPGFSSDLQIWLWLKKNKSKLIVLVIMMFCLDQFSSCDLIGIGFGREKEIRSPKKEAPYFQESPQKRVDQSWKMNTKE